jgi:hypothetical protein
MANLEQGRITLGERFSSGLDRVERIYLRLLRAAILIIATLMICYGMWLAISSLYFISRSPDSVREEAATVAADEITDAETPRREPVSQNQPKINPQYQKYYSSFITKYYGLYRNKFEPFSQKEDKKLTRDEFDDFILSSPKRLELASKGEIDFTQEKADLDSLLAVMTEAATKPKTLDRLNKYKSARKTLVNRQVQRFRTEYRSGWNSYSTACEAWYEVPYGCAERRSVQVPYMETISAMEFPEGTQSHLQIFRAFQDRFLKLLDERRTRNAATAQMEREEILQGRETGSLTLYTSLQIAAGFIALMFFFLLIAIERHQRRIAQNMPSE